MYPRAGGELESPVGTGSGVQVVEGPAFLGGAALECAGVGIGVFPYPQLQLNLLALSAPKKANLGPFFEKLKSDCHVSNPVAEDSDSP